MAVSVVIPTRNRPKSLARTLDAINAQTVKPLEILVIDQSDPEIREKVREICEDRNAQYIFYDGPRSTSAARNYGASLAKGDFIWFIDDDVIPKPDYLGKILEVFKQKPDAVLVWGLVENEVKKIKGWKDRVKLIIKAVFFLARPTDRPIVLPSFVNEYVYEVPKDVVPCQWASTTSVVVRKWVMDEIKFRELGEGYVMHEDLDWSYRIWKKYKGCYFTPFARVFHNFEYKKKQKTRYWIRSMRNRFTFIIGNHTLFFLPSFLWSCILILLLVMFLPLCSRS